METHRFDEAGQTYKVPPEDAGKWASPAFIVDKVGDIFGRASCDYDGPNRESEGQPRALDDTDDVLGIASGKHSKQWEQDANGNPQEEQGRGTCKRN